MTLRTPVLVAVLALAACGKSDSDEKGKDSQEADPAAEDVIHLDEPPNPAHEEPAPIPPPEASEAVALLLRFAEAVEAEDAETQRSLLRIPDGLSEGQIREFLRELRVGGHVAMEGVRQAGELPFGTLQERFGAHAENIAAHSELALDQAWALGGPERGAVFYWDGEALKLAAVHALGAETP